MHKATAASPARAAWRSCRGCRSTWPVCSDHSRFLWRDLPDALIPERDGLPFPSAEVFDVQRLSSSGHWQVPVITGVGQRLMILAWHAGPPAFGGAEERNRRRNHDETAFWTQLLDGRLPMPAPMPPFVLMGNANLDAEAGDGIHAAMQARCWPTPPCRIRARWATVPAQMLRDRRPPIGRAAPARCAWPISCHWVGLEVLDAGLVWPGDASAHALVWMDVAMP
jgi:hypothetical protein